MRAWKDGARTVVKSMTEGDFYSSEKSHIMPKVETLPRMNNPFGKTEHTARCVSVRTQVRPTQSITCSASLAALVSFSKD